VTSLLDLGADYRTAREDVAALVRALGPEQLAAPVPACPGWTVHDVVSHLTGMATDAVNGRLSGMPEPSQTEAQVAERAGSPTSIVLREWERTASQYEVVLSKSSSSSVSAVVGVVVHEQDIRGALGLPGNRDSPIIAAALSRNLEVFASKVESAGLTGVVFIEGADVVAGLPAAPITYRASRFEIFRAVFGRRSRPQIERRFSGTEDPSPYVPLLCVFGPAATDIIE
jgi:uncharacterized protein (TIGR03083 family)